MYILVLDQATNNIGYAIFSASTNCLVTSGLHKTKGKTFDDKLKEINALIDDIAYAYPLKHVVLEDVQSQSNKDTFKKLSILMGVIIGYANIHNISYTVVSVNTWRSKLKIPTHNRELAKQSAVAYVLMNFGLELPHDQCEAICIGTWYVDTQKGA